MTILAVTDDDQHRRDLREDLRHHSNCILHAFVFFKTRERQNNLCIPADFQLRAQGGIGLSRREKMGVDAVVHFANLGGVNAIEHLIFLHIGVARRNQDIGGTGEPQIAIPISKRKIRRQRKKAHRTDRIRQAKIGVPTRREHIEMRAVKRRNQRQAIFSMQAALVHTVRPDALAVQNIERLRARKLIKFIRRTKPVRSSYSVRSARFSENESARRR